MSMEVTREAPGFLVENLVRQGSEGAAPFLASLVKLVKDPLDHRGAAKSVRRLLQGSLEDGKIVIVAKLGLQLFESRHHRMHPSGPDRLEKLQFVIQVLQANPPAVEAVVIAFRKCALHAPAARAVDLFQAHPHRAPVSGDDPEFSEPAAMRFQGSNRRAHHTLLSDPMRHGNLFGEVVVHDEDLHPFLLSLRCAGQSPESMKSDRGITHRSQEPRSFLEPLIFLLKSRGANRGLDQPENRADAFDGRARSVDIFRAVAA
jgi:hypothetical protein